MCEPNCALPRFAGVDWNESRLRLEEARVAIWDQLLSFRPRTPVFCCATKSSTFFSPLLSHLNSSILPVLRPGSDDSRGMA